MIVPIEYKRRISSKHLHLKFYPTNDLLNSKDYKNIRKVRCICLNEDKKVCMISNDGYSNWMLPGGTVERNENPIVALRRELIEEADIEIKHYKLMGFLEVELLNKSTNYISKHSEMIFVAKVDKVLEQTADPAKGFILQRDFFEISDMAYKFVRWGKISTFLEDYLVRLKF
jgi:ADP-ribose pyrophosphatase YjhB (NUDIX family)